MTKDDIIRMAQEAGFGGQSRVTHRNKLLHFAVLVAAAEREACANVCDEKGLNRKNMEHFAALTYSNAAHDCATAIRARGTNAA